MSRPRNAAPFTFVLLSLFAVSRPSPGADAQASAGVGSPDGRVRIELSLATQADGTAAPVYRVSFRGKPVILPSRLGVDLGDGSALGNSSELVSAHSQSIDETYTQFPGKRSRVVNRCEESVIALRERGPRPRKWEIIVRAYNDGAALRYRFPAQEGWKELVVAGERTEFRIPDDGLAHLLPLQGFTTPHEARYEKKPVAEIPPKSLFGLPLLTELRGTGWLAIAEANLTDYAGMYVGRSGNEKSSLACRLAPRPDEPKIAVRAKLPHESPWRAFLIADKVEQLVESDLVLNLNEPSAIPDTAWIRPGKTTFPWWNGFYEADGKVPFKMGLNTETAKYYIDFCAEAGIPYHSLDGLDNVAWYGGTIVPYQGADITRGIDGLDLREVLRYAAAKGVKIRLWMHWAAARAHMDRAFPLYREWGVEGIMLDFMDRDDQEMVNFLRRALELAAANRLTVTLHGVGAPTGLERTFPNLLTSEAVMNLEYDKWDRLGIPPEHELTVPFTRMLAGPLDFHQGSLRGVPVGEFRPRNAAPLVMGTPCRMLASYVVFQNHLPMVADYPSAYRGHPALATLAAIPTTWDETRCLAGSVGEFIVVARRHGKDWWIGAMGGRDPRDVQVTLDFLGSDKFRAEVLSDELNSQARLARRTETVGKADIIRASLAPAGGLLIRLSPATRVESPTR